MLQFLNLSATLAAVVITQVNSTILPVSKDATERWVQASTHDVSPATTVVLTADSGDNTLAEIERVDPTWILGLTALGVGAVGVALSRKNAKKSFKLSPTPAQFSPKFERTIRIQQASRHLQKKLLRLLHDDRDTANRLLAQARLKNPHRSVDWYMEKVIYDLERDRRSY